MQVLFLTISEFSSNEFVFFHYEKTKQYSNPCSMTFEPTGNTHTLLLVGVACAFGMVSHVQQKMTKHTLKEFQEVSMVWNTSPNTRIWSFLKTANLASLAAALLYQSFYRLPEVVAPFWLSVFAFVHISLLALSSSLSSQSFAILTS